MTIQCRKCQVEKPLDEFGRTPTGYRRTCKQCRSEYMREWASANADRLAAERRESYAANREALLEKNRVYREQNRERLRVHQIEYRAAKGPAFESWRAMRDRCQNPNNGDYHSYGGRGIRVCDRWQDDFEAFVDDMGERPEGKTLDRIDVNGNYEPGNCRWATIAEQAQNTRRAQQKAA